MKLGISLSHGASAVLTDENGYLLYALEEERISRKKNHVGIPMQGLKELLENCVTDCVTEVFFGTHSNLDSESANRMLVGLEGNPSNPAGSWLPPYPSSKNLYATNPRSQITNFLQKNFPILSDKQVTFNWVKHHRAHLGCALGMQTDSRSLLFSLDGDGDGESGAIAVRDDRGRIKQVVSLPSIDSLGYLYEAVTNRYNFVGGKHEGKITGLAAFGKKSAAVEFLLNHIEIKNGILRIKRARLPRLLSHLKHSSASRSNRQIIDAAANLTEIYPDLAFAIQSALEDCVCELIDYWVERTGISRVSLAGGVFANVKLNQKLSEVPKVSTLEVFPNMGDAGVSAGAIWHELSQRETLKKGDLFSSMFLSPLKETSMEAVPRNVKKSRVNRDELHVEIANNICQGKIVGLHQGRMEFGPRALGNRSILADARNRHINVSLNNRLKRTEFMPFAPIVLKDFVSDWFVISPKISKSYSYMTVTCLAKEITTIKTPSIVHIDGTSRIQIVDSETHPLLYKVLWTYYNVTLIPILINTSFNVHEEPINYQLQDSIECLQRDAVDVLFYENHKLTL